eukprot:Blabericola_migrator_1__9614@NODE_5246_length_831_cov_8838_151832_g3351_i0_p1_GENE_NODE_5246_length_831_cov_8838_151832_g3351_i0NODE_5246_length_831_cov_8838_151832_g3351_i0_p1_ORF_typecomplete_len175_score22_49_NODE_5246_length_831_cov_8838_151832_g3351_i045569
MTQHLRVSSISDGAPDSVPSLSRKQASLNETCSLPPTGGLSGPRLGSVGTVILRPSTGSHSKSPSRVRDWGMGDQGVWVCECGCVGVTVIVKDRISCVLRQHWDFVWNLISQVDGEKYLVWADAKNPSACVSSAHLHTHDGRQETSTYPHTRHCLPHSSFVDNYDLVVVRISAV